jgi:hypothetical protein
MKGKTVDIQVNSELAARGNGGRAQALSSVSWLKLRAILFGIV